MAVLNVGQLLQNRATVTAVLMCPELLQNRGAVRAVLTCPALKSFYTTGVQ